MISFPSLDNWLVCGRLGNQMFQYAFTRTKAKQLNTKYAIPKWFGDDIFNLKETDRIFGKFPLPNRYYEQEGKVGYNVETEYIKDNTDIFGYLQSYKYFSKDDVYNWYEWKNSVNLNLPFEDSVSVHIRIGDYQRMQHVFHIQTPDYYKKALEICGNKNILVFSDNPEIVKPWFPSNAIIVSGMTREPWEDMYLMTKCTNNIIGNSSFSWWGAFLNKNPQKKVISPIKWFVDGSSSKNNDIYCEDWIKL